MPNQVQVDFVGNAQPLYAVADQSLSKLAVSGDAAGKAYTDALKKRLDIESRATFLRSGESIINARKAGEVAGVAYAEGLTRGARAGRLNLARQGADVFTQVGSGAPLSLIAIQQGPQILDAAAQSGFKLAGAMKAVSAFAAAYGASIGIAAAGIAIIYKITTDIAEAEKQKLKFIENGVAASNRAIIAQKEALKNLKDQRAEAELTREIQARLQTQDIEGLKRRRALLEELFRLNPTGSNASAYRQEILGIDARVAAIPGERTAAANAAMNDRNEAFKRQQRELAEQEQKRIARVKELAETTRNFFQSMRERTNADNPFFKILSDAEKLEEQIKKLDPAFQRLARSQAALATANSLFGARIDNVLGVSDLRQQAASFRNGRSGLTSESEQDRIRRQLGIFGGSRGDISQGVSEIFGNVDPTTLPQNLRDIYARALERQASKTAERLTTSFVRPSGALLTEAEKQQQQLRDSFRSGNFTPEVIQNLLSISNLRNQARFVREGVSGTETAQERLDRQFRELDKLTAANDPQRAALDRRIASLASNVDPTSLRQDTRNRVADSIERNADRLANEQAAATKAIQDNTAMMNRLNQNLEKQISGGANSVEVVVKDETQNGLIATPSPRNPSPASTEALYPTGGGFF